MKGHGQVTDSATSQAHVVVVSKIGVRGRAGIGDRSRNAPRWEDVETPFLKRRCCIASSLTSGDLSSLFTRMRNYVKCL